MGQTVLQIYQPQCTFVKQSMNMVIAQPELIFAQF